MTEFIIIAVVFLVVIFACLLIGGRDGSYAPTPTRKPSSNTKVPRRSEDAPALPRKRSNRGVPADSEVLPHEVTFYMERSAIDMLASASEFVPTQLVAFVRGKWEESGGDSTDTMRDVTMDYEEFRAFQEALGSAWEKVLKEVDRLSRDSNYWLWDASRRDEWRTKTDAEREAVARALSIRYKRVVELSTFLGSLCEWVDRSAKFRT